MLPKLQEDLPMLQFPRTPPPGWRMQIFEVVPGLLIGTRLAADADYRSLGLDAIVDLEDWEWAWTPAVPVGRMYLSFPIEDANVVDPKIRQVATFVAALVGAGQKVLVHCTEGLNRAGVVIARALMAMGWTADDAIELVRAQRGPSVDGFPALMNDAFVEWLRGEEIVGMTAGWTDLRTRE
jgi:hypothetical protein